jgi:hypothetical protein
MTVSRYVHLRSISDSTLLAVALTLVHTLLLAGCSGSDVAPVASGEVSGTAEENLSKNQAVEGAPSGDSTSTQAAQACANGATEACRTPIAARDGYYLCGLGQRTCRNQAWSSCWTDATSAGEDDWTPLNVGCDAPPEKCATEGETRDCVQHLPPSAPGQNNCYDGQEVCQSGAWSTCVQKGL